MNEWVRVLLSMSLLANCWATEYYVSSSTGDDGNAGTSPETSFASLSRAFTGLQSGDVILVAPGSYTGQPNQGLELTVGVEDVQLTGTGAGVVVDLNLAFSSFLALQGSSSISISNITLLNAFCQDMAQPCLLSTAPSSALALSHVTLAGHSVAPQQFLISVNQGNLSVADVSASDMPSGGGFLSVSQSSPQQQPVPTTMLQLTNLRLTGINSTQQPVILVAAASVQVTVTSSLFKNITGLLHPCLAVDSPSSSLQVVGATFAGIISPESRGGAIRSSASVLIADSQFLNNVASFGGALSVPVAAPILIQSCNFLNNVATIQGGALFFQGVNSSSSSSSSFSSSPLSITIQDSLFQDNVNAACFLESNDMTGAADFDNCTFVSSSEPSSLQLRFLAVNSLVQLSNCAWPQPWPLGAVAVAGELDRLTLADVCSLPGLTLGNTSTLLVQGCAASNFTLGSLVIQGLQELRMETGVPVLVSNFFELGTALQLASSMPFTSAGQMTVSATPTTSSFGQAQFINAGEMLIAAGTSATFNRVLFSELVIQPGATLTLSPDSGFFADSVDCYGALTATSSSVITGNFLSMYEDSNMTVQIYGQKTPFRIKSSVILAGTLTMAWETHPSGPASFTVISFNERQGRFDDDISLGLQNGTDVQLVYTSTTVLAQLTPGFTGIPSDDTIQTIIIVLFSVAVAVLLALGAFWYYRRYRRRQRRNERKSSRLLGDEQDYQTIAG